MSLERYFTNPDDYDLDKCGRCGCVRKDHTPACQNHLGKCKKFSDPKEKKEKKRR